MLCARNAAELGTQAQRLSAAYPDTLILTERADIANARLRFASGAIANVTASRVAMKRERKIRFFQADTYVAVDYGDRSIRICRRIPSANGGLPTIDASEQHFSDADPLFDRRVRAGEADLEKLR